MDSGIRSDLVTFKKEPIKWKKDSRLKPILMMKITKALHSTNQWNQIEKTRLSDETFSSGYKDSIYDRYRIKKYKLKLIKH